MNDSAQVNQVYLIFNRPQFLVDSSDTKYILKSATNVFLTYIKTFRHVKVLCFSQFGAV